MSSLFTTLFIVFASVYGITAVYTKIVLKRYNKNVTFLYTEFSDYKNLWILGKEHKKFKLLFILNISSLLLIMLLFILDVISL